MRRLLVSLLVMGMISLGASSADLPPLPVPHANNAVASISIEDKTYIASFMGLRSGKTWADVSSQAYVLELTSGVWHRADVPVSKGRLAATAQAVGERMYLFGGYTVAEDGTEVSTPEVFEFNPVTLHYKRVSDMSLPVDDSVSLTYMDRYIYLVSGWHDKGNVNTVQVYDTQEDRWFRATDFPGKPVFGHAGGIVGGRFVISDGVAVVGKDAEGRRKFATINEGWSGSIDKDDPSVITWKRLPQLPGKGHYRMAAVGDLEGNRVIFIGGTDNAYNYSGIGYDGVPSEAKAHSFAWDFGKETWVLLKDRPVATMDHRGLLKIQGSYITVGGMLHGQIVTGNVVGSSF